MRQSSPESGIGFGAVNGPVYARPIVVESHLDPSKKIYGTGDQEVDAVQHPLHQLAAGAGGAHRRSPNESAGLSPG